MVLQVLQRSVFAWSLPVNVEWVPNEVITKISRLPRPDRDINKGLDSRSNQLDIGILAWNNPFDDFHNNVAM